MDKYNNMKKEKFSIRKRLNSFRYAFNGFRILFKEEHNSWIHLLAATGVLAAAIIFRISTTEWIAVIFAIGLVFTTELVNTAIEDISNFISAEKNDRIKRIKDLSAAAVLIAALTALIIGLIVFVPKLAERCSGY